MMGIGPIELLLVGGLGLVIWVLLPICCWKIVEKTGYPAWWSLGVLIPGVNVALLIMLAFGDWPALKGREALDGTSQGN